MAQFQYDAVQNGFVGEVVKSAGSSISTSAVRVTVDATNAVSKEDVVRQLEAIKAKIVSDTWPPA